MVDMLICKDVLSNSDVKFGTSGARGLVEDFTPVVCAAFVSAFLTRISECFASDTLFLGIDNRPSSPVIAKLCASAASAIGYKVRYFGVLPTPALAFYAIENKQPAIVVTGSHIPFERNGLKFYRPDGEITKADEYAIVTSDAKVTLAEDSFELPIEHSAINAYKARYKNVLPTGTLKNKRIGIYEHSSAGREIYCNILEQLGATVISIGRSDDFVPIDTEAVSEEDRERAKTWSAEFNLDAIFSTDGDGDRPLIADESGEWLRGDIVGLISCLELNIEAIATPVSCNSAIELSNQFQTVKRTRIGSPFVLAEFDCLKDEYSKIAGFEANGGFMLGSAIEYNNFVIEPLPTRDAFLPFITVLARAVRKQCSISALLAELPSRFTASDRLKEVAPSESSMIIAKANEETGYQASGLGIESDVKDKNQVDGLRLTFESGDILHLRPSGNAPELRIYVEADSQVKANELLLTAKKGLKSLIS